MYLVWFYGVVCNVGIVVNVGVVEVSNFFFVIFDYFEEGFGFFDICWVG